jgi:shikimate dehydrogenase
MVDGFGFISAAKAHGFDSAGRRAAVVGAGGVGSAIAYALCESGIGSLALADSDAARLEALSRILREQFPKVEIAHGFTSLAQLDVLVNATPVGMNDSGALPLPTTVLETLAPHTLVADVVTSPELTPFLALAQARGCRIQKGPEMSLAQLELLGAHIGVMPTPGAGSSN